MKRMTEPSESLISLRTAFRRSSNSPRNLAPGDERAQVERDDPLVLEALGHVAPDDALGEALGDRRLADARLADQDRVVLRPPRQDLHDPPDLVVAADDRIELPGAGLGRQVAAVLLEGLVGALGVGRRDALAAADRGEGVEDRLPVGALAVEEPLALATDLGGTEEQMLRGRVLVAEAAGLLLGPVDDALGAGVEGQGAALDLGPAGEDRGELAAEGGQVHAEAAEGLGGHAVIRLHERGEEVLGVEHGALEPFGELLGGENGLLGLLGKAIELHAWASVQSS